MKDEINEWQRLWEQQDVPAVDPNSLIEKFTKVERRYRRGRWGLALSFLLTTLILIWLAAFTTDLWTTAGAGLMLAAMLMILFLYFRAKLAPLVGTESLNSQAYVKAQIEGLKRQGKISTYYMIIYAVLLIAGINLTYFSTLALVDWPVRLGLQLGTSILLSLGFYVSIRKAKGKHKKEIEPLIEALQHYL